MDILVVFQSIQNRWVMYLLLTIRNWKKYVCHRGLSWNFQSILGNGLIPGGWDIWTTLHKLRFPMKRRKDEEVDTQSTFIYESFTKVDSTHLYQQDQGTKKQKSHKSRCKGDRDKIWHSHFSQKVKGGAGVIGSILHCEGTVRGKVVIRPSFSQKNANRQPHLTLLISLQHLGEPTLVVFELARMDHHSFQDDKCVEELYPTPHIHEQMTAYIMATTTSTLSQTRWTT